MFRTTKSCRDFSSRHQPLPLRWNDLHQVASSGWNTCCRCLFMDRLLVATMVNVFFLLLFLLNPYQEHVCKIEGDEETKELSAAEARKDAARGRVTNWKRWWRCAASTTHKTEDVDDRFILFIKKFIFCVFFYLFGSSLNLFLLLFGWVDVMMLMLATPRFSRNTWFWVNMLLVVVDDASILWSA